MPRPGSAGGFLVRSVEECAERLLYLLRNPEEGTALASQGKEVVKERFLLTRLISNELELYADVLDTGRGAYPLERARCRPLHSTIRP